MRRLLIVLALILALASTPAEAAPTLSWDQVLTGSDGSVLANGLEVKSYKVYRCASASANCDKTNGIVIGTVLAPATSFDLAGQPTPYRVFVTAVNIVGESTESVTVKVVPPDAPKNPKL